MSQESGATTWTVADTKNLTVQGERKGGVLIANTAGRVDGAKRSGVPGRPGNSPQGQRQRNDP